VGLYDGFRSKTSLISLLDPERLQRFEPETRLAGSPNPPNLVVVHDVGSERGAPLLVTELPEGVSLRHRLSPGRLPPRTAWSSERRSPRAWRRPTRAASSTAT